MTEQNKLEILQFVREELERLHNAKEQRLYTCHIVERKYGKESAETSWYKQLLKNLPSSDPDFCVILIKKINEHMVKKIGRVVITIEFLRSGAFIDDNDYESRVLMLDYLIKKFE